MLKLLLNRRLKLGLENRQGCIYYDTYSMKNTKFYILVFFFFITTYLKFSGLKQYTSIISQVLWVRSWSMGLLIRASQTCLEAFQGRIHLQTHLGSWKSLFPCGCMANGLLLTGYVEGHPQVLGATIVPCHVDLAMGSSQYGHRLPQSYQENCSPICILYNIIESQE